jgi:F-type H+-transporting ATPase subunit b
VYSVLEQVAVMFEEIALEIGHEFTAYPVRMAAEAVQFVLLITIVWVVAMGWGKRRGFVANMLAERAERTAREIEVASHSSRDLVVAKQIGGERLDAAAVEARNVVEAAEADAAQLDATSRDEADAEANRILERAQAALVSETEQMRAELREELVSIVALATRSILSEKLSVAEQRASIESAIVASLGAEPTPQVEKMTLRKPKKAVPIPLRSKAMS